jgi:hypothetical protein
MKKTIKNISQLEKEADRLFSLLVRQKNAEDGYVFCCTCGKLMRWRESHNGHFMSRRHKSTRYHEKNTSPQCTYCNTYDQGKQFEFGIFLDKKHGKGTAESMHQISKMECKRNSYDYLVMIDNFKKELIKNNFQTR